MKPSLFTPQVRRVLLSCLILVALRTVTAHEDLNYHMTGLRPCVDTSSVYLDVVGIEKTSTVIVRGVLLETLGSSLKSILSSAQVEAEFSSSCRGKDSFLLLYARISALDPAVYGLGDKAYGYTLALQVGEHAEPTYISSHFKLLEPGYAAFKEEIYSETEDGITIEQHLVSEARSLLESFALVWWEDNMPGSNPGLDPRQLGILLTILVVAILVLKLRGRRPG